MKNRTYREMICLRTFKERYEYLRLSQIIGERTFGLDRYLNQDFYRSKVWKEIRDKVIVRDRGCDLAVPGYEIWDRIYIHHINPITIDELEHSDFSSALDINNLVCCSFDTHQAIHYGHFAKMAQEPVERKQNDTIPWR